MSFEDKRLYKPSLSRSLIVENAWSVSLISSKVCEAVGINLNKIKPLGITG